MKKLHLGCGQKKIYGFINVDIREEVEPDTVYDITKVSEIFEDVDLIYSAHVLEHFSLKPSSFSPITYMEVLEDWYKTLSIGGILRLSVPDFDKIIEYYKKTDDLKSVISFIYGGEKHDKDFHYHCWNFNTLRKDLEEVGFKNVERYDWRKLDHSYIDDYSQSYLPHMDKVNG